MNLKLYHWESLEALGQFSCGEAFALADSPEHAKKIILKEFGKNKDQREINELKKELETKTPKVYSHAKAFCIWGSA